MIADAFEQGLLDCPLVGFGIGTARKADRAEPTAARGCYRSGPGIEVAVVTRLDSAREQVEHRLFVDGGGGKDAGAGGAAGNLADREPIAAGERARGIEPEASTSDRLPAFDRRIAPTADAVWKGEGQRFCEPMFLDTGFRHVQPAPPPCGELPPGFGARRSIRHPTAPATLQVGIVA